ncbi:MAG: septum site-determining protein MinC [Burkholderia sp.]
MSLKKSPFFELRSGSIDSLLFVVKTTDLNILQAELVKRFEVTPEFFADDVVVIDVRRLAEDEHVSLDELRGMLNDVRMWPIGVAAQPEQQCWAAAGGLPLLEARNRRVPTARPVQDEARVAEVPAAAPDGAPQTLVIDRPLRSGQQIYATGDLVVLAPVSNGAEVIAEGNIHVYAPLRGRALAGVLGNHDARIFCTCLEPELVSIAGIYRTTENPLPAEVVSKSVQIRLEDDKLMIKPLRLT